MITDENLEDTRKQKEETLKSSVILLQGVALGMSGMELEVQKARV